MPWCLLPAGTEPGPRDDKKVGVEKRRPDIYYQSKVPDDGFLAVFFDVVGSKNICRSRAQKENAGALGPPDGGGAIKAGVRGRSPCRRVSGADLQISQFSELFLDASLWGTDAQSPRGARKRPNHEHQLALGVRLASRTLN